MVYEVTKLIYIYLAPPLKVNWLFIPIPQR